MIWVLVAPLLIVASPVYGQDERELAKNPPVAIVSLVQGDAQVRHVDGEWRPLYWLDLVRPEDRIRTADNGKVVVTFFHDDHMEVIDPLTQAVVSFRELKRELQEGKVRKYPASGRVVMEIPIPYMMMRKLFAKEFVSADEPEAWERENIFLASWVKATTDPPVFYWKDVGAPSYRIQLFNEWDEFVFEATSKSTRFKYPYHAPRRLARNSLYKWQVVTSDDQIVVRKYPFVLLTTLHAREVIRAEKRFEALKKKGKLMPYNYVDLFLLYVQRNMIDKYLHLLEQMAELDPENPVIYRALVRAYLDKGCPAHARQALEKERQLGGRDPLYE